MSDPVTRQEQLLSTIATGGDIISPVTREEMYLAYMAGDTSIVLPEPVTRKEQFLYQACLNGGSGGAAPVIQPISITENGTYEATDGVDGYSPVTVAIESGGVDSVGIILDTENTATAFGSQYPKKVVISLGSFSSVPSYTLLGAIETSGAYIFGGLGDKVEEITFSNCNKETTFYSYAFYKLYNLKKITIPSCAYKIEKGAFYNCAALDEVTFTSKPGGAIHSYAFDGCSSLATINVPWAEGEVANAPWGANNATINYNYTGG